MKGSSASAGRKAWHALRFILFGLPGFCVMLYSAVALFGRFYDRDLHFISPFLSLPLMIIGALLMLYGVGEWKRWAYLWVFLSIPASLCVLFVIPGIGSKVLPVIVIAAAAFAIHARVRVYYARSVPDQSQELDHAG
jgi:hypothetical protein